MKPGTVRAKAGLNIVRPQLVGLSEQERQSIERLYDLDLRSKKDLERACSAGLQLLAEVAMAVEGNERFVSTTRFNLGQSKAINTLLNS